VARVTTRWETDRTGLQRALARVREAAETVATATASHAPLAAMHAHATAERDRLYGWLHAHAGQADAVAAAAWAQLWSRADAEAGWHQRHLHGALALPLAAHLSNLRMRTRG
jgi:uncharacterized membrane protein